VKVLENSTSGFPTTFRHSKDRRVEAAQDSKGFWTIAAHDMRIKNGHQQPKLPKPKVGDVTTRRNVFTFVAYPNYIAMNH
jgi:hypothetical protein